MVSKVVALKGIQSCRTQADSYLFVCLYMIWRPVLGLDFGIKASFWILRLELEPLSWDLSCDTWIWALRLWDLRLGFEPWGFGAWGLDLKLESEIWALSQGSEPWGFKLGGPDLSLEAGMGFEPGFEPWEWDLILKAGIWGFGLGFEPQGWDLIFEAEIWTSRMGFVPWGWDLSLDAGI